MKKLIIHILFILGAITVNLLLFFLLLGPLMSIFDSRSITGLMLGVGLTISFLIVTTILIIWKKYTTEKLIKSSINLSIMIISIILITAIGRKSYTEYKSNKFQKELISTVLNTQSDSLDEVLISTDIGRCITGNCKDTISEILYSDRKYFGEFKNGKFHGQGKLIYNDSTVFEGTWKDNELNGLGKYFSSDGDYYKGVFENGLYHGIGAYYDKSEDTYFDGEWENGELMNMKENIKNYTQHKL